MPGFDAVVLASPWDVKQEERNHLEEGRLLLMLATCSI